MVQNFVAGGAAINQLCKAADAELRVYEMALDRPTADFTAEPAMSEEDCAKAMAYGMMAVEPGLDLLCLGEMGIANTTSAAALAHALFGGSAADWTGPGTGVAGAPRCSARPRWWPPAWPCIGRPRATPSTSCAGSAGRNWRPSAAP
mgnify:CR=1 FL=1